jgi:hypothetical protein
MCRGSVHVVYAPSVQKRALQELIDVEQPAWPLIQSWVDQRRKPVEIPDAPEADRAGALEAMQVTIASPLGAVVYETGGILVDYGWLRILGAGGNDRLRRSLPEWNFGRTFGASGATPGFVLVADDVVGGFFALDGGALGDGRGLVYYHAPDTLRWEPTGLDYAHFLHWAITETSGFAKFYELYRWPTWEADVRNVPGDRTLSIEPWPFLAGAKVSQRDRRSVPVGELYDLYVNELPQRHGGANRG